MKASRKEKKRGTGSIGGHVVAGVKHHQEANAGDQCGDHPCEAIHPQVELETKLWDPGHSVMHTPPLTTWE